MLHKTRGIVLRAVKYGDTSLICTIFTEAYGTQSYMMQGVRSAKSKQQKAGLLQPATLLDLVVYQKPLRSMQRIREFHPAFVYHSMQEEVVKNSIALFSVELLLRLLPEHAQAPELFRFCYDYFCMLDEWPVADVANFPLFFISRCSQYLGYELKGNYSEQTPHLSLHAGGFTAHPPSVPPYLTNDEAHILDNILKSKDTTQLKELGINAAMRYRLLDWYIQFLQLHTQHLGNIRSLAVLQEVLH
jgi:DNA repair protein RecO (recombination protein O)